MQIRRLTVANAFACRKLRLEGLRTHPTAFTSSIEEAEAAPLVDTRTRLASPRQLFWGAFEAGALCGMVGLELEARVKVRHKGTVVGMVVAAGHAGRGIGRALLEALVREALARRLELLLLTVTEGNDRACRLYQRAGFRSFGIEPQGIKVDGVPYAKNHMVLEFAKQ